MLLPFNVFTTHSLISFIVTAPLAVMFYIVYLKAGRRLIDLLAANFTLCISIMCVNYFLMDNLVPVGMSSLGWVGGPTAESLRSYSLELTRYAWALGVLTIPAQLHFVLCYCQKQNFLRRHIRAAYGLAALAAPTIWTSAWLTAPDTPIAETSSWIASLPWLPEPGPMAPLLFLCVIALQVYGLVLLWKTRHLSETKFSDSLGSRHIVFAAFVVQMTVGLVDIATGSIGLAVPVAIPLGSGIMGLLLAIAVIRSRVDADRTRFQLAGEKAALLECIPQPLLYVGKDLRIQWANKSAAEFAGKEPAELVGARTDQLWRAGQAESVPAQEALETGQPVKREIVCEDESTWMVHASPVMGATGKLNGAIELAMDITEIRRAQETLRDSNIKILMAREEERRRVAQDLHDSVAQGLSALQMQLRANGTNIDNDSAVGQQFISASKRCEQLGADIRQISHQLYPPALDLMGFAAALDDILDQYRATGMECDFECTDELRRARFSQNAEVALYRTVQEAMNNATRHGHARKISVTLARTDDELHLTVTDNGIGFDVENNQQGLGMISMKGRLDGIAGKMDIASRPGRTSLSVSAPLKNIAKSPEPAAETAQAGM